MCQNVFLLLSCKAFAEVLEIDWGKYGHYTMNVAEGGKTMEGCYTGYPDDWRKAAWKRALDPTEVTDAVEGPPCGCTGRTTVGWSGSL